jgi:hypothetical protein
MRNAHDINHAKQGFSLEIENFKLNPGNKFSTPGWRFDWCFYFVITQALILS